MKSKKVLLVLASCFLVASLAACRSGTAKTDTNTNTTDPTTPTDPTDPTDPEDPPVTETVYSIKVGSNTANFVADTGSQPANVKKAYSLSLTNLVKNQAVTFYADNVAITSGIGSDQEDDNNKNLIQGQVGSFVIHNDAASSTISLKIYQDGGMSFWATGYVADDPVNPPVPQEVVYSVKVGDNEAVELVKDENATLAQDQNAQYSAELTNLAKDEVVVFYADGVAIEANIGSDPENEENKNLIQGQVGSFVIHNDAATSDLYFKTWANGGMSFWATGYVVDDPVNPPAPVEVNWYIGGRINGATEWSNQVVKMEAYASEDATVAEQYHAEVAFLAEDQWKVISNENEPRYMNGLENEVVGMHVATEGDDNIIVDDAGTYDIYFKIYNNGAAPSIWAAKQGGDPVNPPVEDIVFSIQVGDNEAVELVKDENATLADDQTAQYTADLANLVKDEAVVFYADGVAIEANIGSDPENEENKNLIQGQVGSFVIHNDADASNIYFKTWANGGMSFWATGYVASPDPVDPPEPVTEVNWYVGGRINGATEWSNQVVMMSEAVSEDTTVSKQYHAEVSFLAEDQWKVISDEDEPRYINALETGVEGMHIATVGDDNIIVDDAGTYDIYFKIYNDGREPSIWAAKQADPVDPPVEDIIYSVKVGENEAVELVKDETADLAEGQNAQYSAELANLVKDEAVVFYADGVAIEANIGSDPENEENKNLIQGEFGSFVIHNDADASTFYFKTWATGGLSFWATGYVASADPVEPVEPVVTQGWYLVGTFNEWQAVEDGGYAMSVNPENENEYVINNVALDAEAQLKIYNSGTYYGYETVKEGCKSL
ncbi:MAG: hypothetical protein K6F07_02460, partial [Bacilli bacterium]|nr:hypothetical protein [Bacilli bacterium]